MKVGLSLNKKLFFLVGFLVAVIVVVSGVSYIGLQQASKEYESVASINFKKVLILGKLRAETQNFIRNSLKLSLEGITRAELESTNNKRESGVLGFSKIFDEYKTLPAISGEEPLRNDLIRAWEKATAVSDKMGRLLLSSKTSERLDGLRIGQKEFDDSYHDVMKSFEALFHFNEIESQKSVKLARDVTQRSNWIDLIILLLGGTFGFTVGTLIARDLSHKFIEISVKLQTGAKLLAETSTKTATSSEKLAKGASEQAASLQEIVSSVEEVKATVAKSAENAKRSEEMSVSSEKVANEGKQAVTQMLQSIDEISQSADKMAHQIQNNNEDLIKITQMIAEIGNKTKVINDIVFQTKLLSFNASVEAARAGEHGKGFSIVAEEVGNLAQMSGTAAKEITQMLDQSINSVDEIVTKTKTNTENLVAQTKAKVGHGAKVAQQCGEVLGQIVTSVSEIKHRVEEIAGACNEQSLGVGEISKAMLQLEEVTQDNTGAAHETALASDALEKHASELRHIIKTLVFAVEGGSFSDQPTQASIHTLHTASDQDQLSIGA